MKYGIILFLFLALFSCKKENIESKEYKAVDMHNSQISLDLTGTYTGFVPCADCEGISVRIVLNCDQTYELFYRYVGKSDEYYECSGDFNWNNDGNSIILDCETFAKNYFVGENYLVQYDINGNRISGELEDKYRLTKIE